MIETTTIILSTKLTKNNTLEVVKKTPSNLMYASNPPRPAPDRVFKEVYGVVEGKIKLLETIEGIHQPAYQVEEKIIF